MDFGELDRMIFRHGAARVVDIVSPFLTEARKQRIERVLAGRLDSIHVGVERPEDPHNAAAIVRSAESFGAMHVHAIEAPPSALHAPSTTQGAYCWVHTHHHEHRAGFVAAVRGAGAKLAGAIMDGALTIEELACDGPLCVLFGNEKVGLSDAMLDACDVTFRIPMVGMSESLNLSVSAAITLYTVTQARRRAIGRPGELSDERLALERARYYARSVELRLLEGLLEP